jgi:hypothetical protein
MRTIDGCRTKGIDVKNGSQHTEPQTKMDMERWSDLFCVRALRLEVN